MQSNTIWIIDPDTDDHDMLLEIKEELNLPNELIFMNSAAQALDQLPQAVSAPFIIICELNLPGMNGFELREKMLNSNSPNFKSVPFIFWSTQALETQVAHAYELSVHGFFIKDSTYGELKKTFIDIINYWQKSEIPSNTEMP